MSCYNCQFRKPHCHAQCKEYQDYHAERLEISRKKKLEYDSLPPLAKPIERKMRMNWKDRKYA